LLGRDPAESPPDDELRQLREQLLAANADRLEHLLSLLRVDDEALHVLAEALRRQLDEPGDSDEPG